MNNFYQSASLVFIFTTITLFSQSILSQDMVTQIKSDRLLKPEAGEQFPGGQTTHVKKLNQDSFSHGSANMSFENELNFKIGNGVFRRLWVSAPTKKILARPINLTRINLNVV